MAVNKEWGSLFILFRFYALLCYTIIAQRILLLLYGFKLNVLIVIFIKSRQTKSKKKKKSKKSTKEDDTEDINNSNVCKIYQITIKIV